MSKEHPIFPLLSPVIGDWRKAVKLVESGLDVSINDEQGEPLICRAALSGSWEVFEALLKQGADPLASNAEGITAFHYALAGAARANWKYWSQRQIRGSRKMIAYYVENQRPGMTAKTLLALVTNKLPALRTLLREGFDPDTRIEDPLRVLLLSDPKKVLRAADLDRRHRMAGKGFPAPPTLLMWAAGLGRTAFVDLLTAHGADQNARDDLGYTAADYADIYRSGEGTGSIE